MNGSEQRIGRVVFQASQAGGNLRFETAVPSMNVDSALLLVTCDVSAYPLRRHMRYARHQGNNRPYTYSHFTFHDTPPGILVGPWPAWRGIPPMPRLRLRDDPGIIEGRAQFWGDEMSEDRLRYLFHLATRRERTVTLESEEPGIIPLHADLYSCTDLTIHSVDLIPVPDGAEGFPRLLFPKEEIEPLRERARTDPRGSWGNVRALLRTWDLPHLRTDTSKVVDSRERLGPDDRLPVSALMALLEPSKENVRRAETAVGACLALLDDPAYEPLRIDTQCGELLFNMCVAYDWIESLLPDGGRREFEGGIGRVASRCRSFLESGRSDYAQAHFLGCGLGFLAYAFLFRERDRELEKWLSYLYAAIRKIVPMYSDDGFYPHGINLWSYEFGFLLRWFELFRVSAGIDMWRESTRWVNASRFRACATSEDGLYAITFGGPQYRVGGESWCHDLICLRTGSGEARWMADFLREKTIEGIDFRHVPPRRRVYEFLFNSGDAEPSPPSESRRIFHDGGQIYVRLPDPGKRSLFTFRCGYPLGRTRYDAGEYGGYGHSEPMNGAFLYYRDGDFIASGAQPVYRLDTSLHNAVTIDGQGQIGSGPVWMPEFVPEERIPGSPAVRESGDALLIDADLTKSYLPGLQARKVRRSLCLLGERALVGVDIIHLAEPRIIEWNYHSWLTMNEGRSEDGKLFILEGNEGAYRLCLFSPAAAQCAIGLTECVPAYPHDGRRDYHLKATVHSGDASFVWCLLLEPELSVTYILVDNRTPCMFLEGESIRYDPVNEQLILSRT